MPSANTVELETSLRDCVAYCERHPNSTVSEIFREKLVMSQRRYYESIRTSDEQHVKWRTEQREQKLAWKHLAGELRDVQNRLRRMGAIDFPSERILYWDEQLLVAAIARMQSYLTEHQDNLEFATGSLEKFERLLSDTRSEGRDADEALRSFQRFVDLRREAMTQAAAIIGEFRVALRRTVGKKDPEYNAIFWPYAIASSEGVLF